MKKFITLVMVAGFGSPAFADITHKMTSSFQLQTNAAATQVSRIGSTYSASGSGVTRMLVAVTLLTTMLVA